MKKSGQAITIQKKWRPRGKPSYESLIRDVKGKILNVTQYTGPQNQGTPSPPVRK